MSDRTIRPEYQTDMDEVSTLRSELERERAAGRSAEARLARYIRELERSNADLEQFAYAASHDLQEPLRMVAQFSQLLDQRLREAHPDAAEDGEVRLCLGHISTGADRSRSLIRGLLDYSRIGRQSDFQTMDLDGPLDDAIDMLNGAVAEAGAEIVRNDLPVAWCDRAMLSRLLLNLITNAIRFAVDGRPAKIHISAEVDDDEVVVSVADNGIGIDPKHAEKIFGIFARLDPSRPGTGIGLSICQKIVNRHGGRIWVESSLGAGATFRFTLLRDDPSAEVV